MNGQTNEIGAVAVLKRHKGAINVARQVMEQTYHTLIVGEDATMFAKRIGFDTNQNLSTPDSVQQWKEWVLNGRQPNFWKKQPPPPPVHGAHLTTLGKTTSVGGSKFKAATEDPMHGHDTIALIAVDKNGLIGCGTSTNA